MKKTIKIIKREFTTKVFSKGFLISTLIGPVIIMGFYYIPLFFREYAQEAQMMIHFIDRTGEFVDTFPKMFTDTLENGQPHYIITPIDEAVYLADKESFHKSLEEDLIDALIIIPETVFEGDPVKYLTAILPKPGFKQLVQQRIGNLLNRKRLLRAGLDPPLIANLTRPAPIKIVKISTEKDDRNFESKYSTTFIFLMILYITILIYGASVMRGVLEEKTSRILEVLLSSSNSFQLMMGKLIGVGSVGLVQYLIWSIVALGSFYLIGAAAPATLKNVQISSGTFFYFLVFFLIGYFQFSTLYAAVGAMCSTQEDAQAMSAPITFLVVIPFIITISLGLSDPNSSLSQLLSLMPFFAPMLMFVRVELSNPPLWEISLSIFINLVTIIFFTWIAAKIYRIGTLMYGKRPAISEVIKWFKYR